MQSLVNIWSRNSIHLFMKIYHFNRGDKLYANDPVGDLSCGKIYFRSIRIYSISNLRIFFYLGESIFRWKIVGFCFAILFKLLPNFSEFINYDDCIRKIKQTISSFYSKKDLNLIKKGVISSEKIRIQILITMIMLTRS